MEAYVRYDNSNHGLYFKGGQFYLPFGWRLQRARYSIVYEFTPVSFLQLRAAYRRYRGIPQSNVENQRLSFVELHGYF